MKKLLSILLIAILSVATVSATFEEQILNLSFDIKSGTDTREFGFSSTEITDSSSSPTPFTDNKAVISNTDDSNTYTLVGETETIHVYWKVVSSEDFELELEGSALTLDETEASVSADSELKTIHIGTTWDPSGYAEADNVGKSKIGFGESSSNEATYEADEVYNHNPSEDYEMNDFDSIPIVITTEDAQGKVPGTYKATLTLRVKSSI